MEINKPYDTNIIGINWRKVIYLGFNQNKKCHVVGLYDEYKYPSAAEFKICRLNKDGYLELSSDVALSEVTNSEREYIGGLLKKL